MCVATFNGDKYIEEQISSILKSPLVSRVLVSDDGSTDQTLPILKKFSDPRIKVLKGPQKGLVRNFEFLLTQTSADYIFLSDQDDVWLDSKVGVMLGELQSCDLVLSNCIVTDESLDVIYHSYFKEVHYPRIGLLSNLYKNSYLGCCIAIHRRMLAYALPFPSMVVMHDWWLGLVSSHFGRVSIVHQPLIKYRRHSTNYSTTGEASKSSIFLKLKWRLKMISSLLEAIFRKKLFYEI